MIPTQDHFLSCSFPILKQNKIAILSLTLCARSFTTFTSTRIIHTAFLITVGKILLPFGFHLRKQGETLLVYLQSTFARQALAWRATMPVIHSRFFRCDKNFKCTYLQACCSDSFCATWSLPSLCTRSSRL